MARILVTGDHRSVAGRDALARIVERLRHDGHDACQFGAQDEDVEAAVRGCDAVIGVLDRIEAGGAALTAYAHAQQKPVLGLTGDAAHIHPVFQEIATLRDGRDVAAWLAHLPEFYDHIRPYAGRVVRDRIPELVREAGHEVSFRRLTDDEKPRFLKQKIANEAQELARAELAGEKEEVADVLEALEAFILARRFDRDDLRRIKEGKRKRRGGFEQGFVVEATVPKAADDSPAPETEMTGARDHDPQEEDDGATASAPDDGDAQGHGPQDEEGTGDDEGRKGDVVYEYGDEPDPDIEEPDNVAPEQRVGSRFFEL